MSVFDAIASKRSEVEGRNDARRKVRQSGIMQALHARKEERDAVEHELDACMQVISTPAYSGYRALVERLRDGARREMERCVKIGDYESLGRLGGYLMLAEDILDLPDRLKKRLASLG